ncbi:radical SAM/SPASM family putative metalloenzyme maturase [bacterium]|nr:radical SAM/SPASM family putative metalloenzyme maturase [bacterium]
MEPTTRCNLRCEMCVKQAPGNAIRDGDLSLDLFERLRPGLQDLETVVFSGIGEPLLHPGLERMIAAAGGLCNNGGTIGLQTNGTLLNVDRVRSLLTSGLNELCISLDSVNPDIFSRVRAGGNLDTVKQAFAAMNTARSELKRDFRFGVEFVVMKQNLQNLPAVIQWAAENGASFAIVTHLLPYGKSMESQCINSPNLNVSRQLYQRYKTLCEERYLELDRYLEQRWRYHWNTSKKEGESEVMALGRDMINYAYENNIPLHLKNLMSEDEATLDETKRVFEEAGDIAAATGLELTLPELFPRYDRQCHFIEKGSLFVAQDGQVYPCYFLWHQYSFYQNGLPLKVTPLSFGDLGSQSIEAIWSSETFAAFQNKVLAYDYPYCGNCNLGPCNLFTAKRFEYDCYARDIPCGSCPWCGGLLNCLQ